MYISKTTKYDVGQIVTDKLAGHQLIIATIVVVSVSDNSYDSIASYTVRDYTGKLYEKFEHEIELYVETKQEDTKNEVTQTTEHLNAGQPIVE